MPSSVRISELYIYPIKSLSGLCVERLIFDAAGPVDDRRWMLVDAKGRFVSQRGLPMLARFGVEATASGYRITAPDGSQRDLPRSVEAEQPISVTVWKDSLDGWEVSAELSTWFSEQLGQAVRLVHVGPNSQRRIPDAAALDSERVGFADGYPLLLCNQASLEALQQRAGQTLAVRRFRPNLVVTGMPADEELQMGRLTLTQGRLDLLKPCERCNIPAVDPQAGEYQRDVAQALKTHSRFNGKTIFGANAVARDVVELKVGDAAEWQVAASA